jgi:hypothetical protein
LEQRLIEVDNNKSEEFREMAREVNNCRAKVIEKDRKVKKSDKMREQSEVKISQMQSEINAYQKDKDNLEA